MTKSELIIQTKATALNSIRKLYHPLSKPLSCCYQEGETQEGRRDSEVRGIIKQLEKELIKIKKY